MSCTLSLIKYYLIDGRRFDDMQAVVDHYKVNLKTYYNRVDGGMTPHEALTKPVRKY
jgi:hypothetical protein